jgi:hypothetical protein
MDNGVPQPTLEREGTNVLLAYRTSRKDDHFAILQFDEVRDLSFGDPNDETLESHRLYAHGLEPYRFHEIHEDDGVPSGFRRWIVTFHDDTLDVVARSARVVIRATAAESAGHALAAFLA